MICRKSNIQMRPLSDPIAPGVRGLLLGRLWVWSLWDSVNSGVQNQQRTQKSTQGSSQGFGHDCQAPVVQWLVPKASKPIFVSVRPHEGPLCFCKSLFCTKKTAKIGANALYFLWCITDSAPRRWCMYSLCWGGLHCMCPPTGGVICGMCILFWCVHSIMLMLVINKKLHHLLPACARALHRISVYSSTVMMDSYSIIHLKIRARRPAPEGAFSDHERCCDTWCSRRMLADPPAINNVMGAGL